MDRGEVDIVGAYGLPGMLATPSGLDRQRRGDAPLSGRAQAHALLPNVPTLPELGVSDEGRAVLRAIAATAEIGRSIITGPGVPPERLAALRAAFAAMLKDPDFLAACEQRHFMVDPGSGEEMDAIVQDTFPLPPAVLRQDRRNAGRQVGAGTAFYCRRAAVAAVLFASGLVVFRHPAVDCATSWAH